MIKVISAQRPCQGNDTIMTLAKRILIFNISSARNSLIRIPLKLCIIVIVLVLRLFKSDSKVSVKEVPEEQASPSSVSVLLDTEQSVARKHVSRTCLSHKFSTFSIIKSTSKSSLVNFFTPDCCLNETMNCMSDIYKHQKNPFEKEQENSDLNDTDLDCDSLDSSLYNDSQKTEFSSQASDSSFNFNYFKKVSRYWF